MADPERDDAPTDELPTDPATRRAAVLAQFDDFKAQLAALTRPEGPMTDDRDTTAPHSQVERPTTMAALLAALEVSDAWAEPWETARHVATIYQSIVVGLLKLDPSQMPVALGLHAEVTQHIAECVAALEGPGDTRH